ncbi:YjbH domain-containing protein [Thioclava dalianensis]|uniref:YjbH domain-containing protein n=1 Tax=Thioclava dalianensis TaxID=1185766 RepID=UPI0009DE6A01|nr:YjbH domain-containing protein [Thioclava dalianensis]
MHSSPSCGFLTPCLCLALICAGSTARAQGLSRYGMPGLIDTPSATTMPDGTVALSADARHGETRLQGQFQITPRISGLFRYAVLRDFFSDPGRRPDLFDRSFDLHVLLREESPALPAFALGLRDFGGTGIYGSEYLVASKHITPRLTLSAGLGWGRLGSHNGFSNPLGVLSDRFKSRRSGSVGTGRLAFGNFFRGDAALFGGLEYQITPRSRLMIEYSSDAYRAEAKRTGLSRETALNLGVDYRARPNLTLGGYLLGGTELGVKLNYVIDPRAPKYPGGIERGGPPILPQADLAALGWRGDDISSNETRLSKALAAQGLALEGYAQSGHEARIVLGNARYGAAPEALGRAARAMANNLPPEITDYAITLERDGMPVSRSEFRRRDLVALEHDWDGSWRSFARAKITDAPNRPPPLAGRYPRLTGAITPYFAAAYFDPDAPTRYDLGVQVAGKLALAPGLSLSTVIRQKALGTLDQSTRASNSTLPHVRSDQWLYDKADGPVVHRLMADYLFRPGSDLYARLSLGYLERMFAGVSGELLWYPQTSRIAWGAELNYTAQRAPQSRFGLRDYRIASGTLSAYSDLGGGYLGQINAGRFLAGDWGARFALDREFANGIRIGAFFTLTDVSFDRFGEGAFDKGIRVSVPVSWLTGQPGTMAISQTLRPIQRDGGARLEIANRLYDEVLGANAQVMMTQWGKFWR